MNKTLLLCVAAVCIGIGGAQADEWTRVTDASVLSAGDRIVIACPAKGKAAGALDTSKKILTAVAATFSNDENIMTSAGDAIVLTIGGEQGIWTLADATGRMLGASGTKDIGWILLSSDAVSLLVCLLFYRVQPRNRTRRRLTVFLRDWRRSSRNHKRVSSVQRWGCVVIIS